MSIVERVLIQKKGGEFVTSNGCVAWLGFDKKGYLIDFFEWPRMQAHEVPVAAETLVVGGVGTVLYALRALGVQPPVMDLPECLQGYLRRKVWTSTWCDMRARVIEGSEPLFVKPRRALKAFTGHVISEFCDLIATASLPDDMELWVSECVEFVSEWRYFVHRHEVVGVGYYRGDPFRVPNADTVRAAVRDFREIGPIGYGIDFGVTADGRTLLVEVNDGYSLGCMGLRPVAYANLLEDRWNELVSSRPETRTA